MQRLTVLLTNLRLDGRSGTEVYVKDLALELQRRGHRPIVYTPLGEGGVADELRRSTVPVVQQLEQIAREPDVIHGHHAHQVMAALLHFERTPALFFCHDFYSWHDEPPLFPRILRYVPVDHTCLDRVVCESGVPESRVQVSFNFVDLARFRPRAALPAQPQRALAFSHFADPRGGYFAELARACAERGIALDAAGARSGRLLERPEELLGEYDVVFAKGKSALEALAVGAAVILCDHLGLGPLVSSDRLEELRVSNFGWRQLRAPVSAAGAAAELARYDAADAAEVSRRVRGCAGLAERVDELLVLYAAVIREQRERGPIDRAAEWRALAAYMERISHTGLRLGTDYGARARPAAAVPAPFEAPAAAPEAPAALPLQAPAPATPAVGLARARTARLRRAVRALGSRALRRAGLAAPR